MRWHRRRLALVSGVALLGACTALGTTDPPVVVSLIDALPAQVPGRASTGKSILVFTPETRAMIASTQMAYTVRAHEVAYYARHRWAETPAQMLQPLLVHTLEETGAFGSVLSPPYTGRYTYGCRTEILELVQDFTQEPPQARIELRVLLSDDTSGRLLASRDIMVRVPMQQRTAEAGVIASNAAITQALREVASFVVDQLP